MNDGWESHETVSSDPQPAMDAGQSPEGVTPRRRWRRPVAAGAVVALATAGVAGAAIGHEAWPGSSAASIANNAVGVAGGGGSLPGNRQGAAPYGENPSGGANSFGGSKGQSGPGSSSSTGSSSNTDDGPSDAAAIATHVDPGVVDITTTLNDGAAAGTGMVLTSSGEVLTNNHVIDGATSISVRDVGNGKTYSATVVGYDRSVDVAVLQLKDASGLSTVTTASSEPSVGAAVVGIGNAGGTGGTPSYAGGAITANDRSIIATDSGDGTSERLTGLLETDAGIQAGDSGGPLVDTNGEVVGMDTAASAHYQFGSSEGSGQGFAIPITTALSAAREIEAGQASSSVHIGPTAVLGVYVSARVNRYAAVGSGVPIEAVVPGGPAAKAGLKVGDAITSIDGASVSTANALTRRLSQLNTGDTLTIGYATVNGQRGNVRVTLESGPPR